MELGRKKAGRAVAAVVGIALAAGLFSVAKPASASFPGTNGLIAFQENGDIKSIPPTGGAPTQLTFGGGFSNPKFNAQGTTLVAETATALVTFPATANPAITVIPGTTAADDDPGFDPTGQNVTFENTDDIFRTTLTGGARTNLTNTAALEGEPDWSADGTFIVFDDDTAPITISRIGPNGGAQTPVVTCATSGDCDEPQVSANNQTVVFDNDAAPGLRSALADGSSAAALVITNGNDDNPAPSPDNALVAYDDGNSDLTTVAANGGGSPTVVYAGSISDATWAIGTPPTPPPGSGSVLSIANAPKAKNGLECVFPLTSTPPGAGTATVTVGGDTSSLDGAAPTTATFEADGSSSLTVNVKNKRKKKQITVTLSAPSAGDTLGTATATCDIGKKKR